MSWPVTCSAFTDVTCSAGENMKQSGWHELAPWRHACWEGARSAAALMLVWLLPLSAALAQTPQAAPAQTPPPSDLKIVVLEGAGAINNIRQHRAKDPVVQVADQAGAPVKDASVTFLLPATGPSGVFGASGRTLTVLTDEKGQAAGRGLVPNQVPGKFEIHVVASYREQRARALITQTNATPAEAAGGGSSKKFLLIALIGGAVAGGAFAAMGHGGSSTASPGAPVQVTNPQGAVIVPGNPVFQPPH